MLLHQQVMEAETIKMDHHHHQFLPVILKEEALLLLH